MLITLLKSFAWEAFRPGAILRQGRPRDDCAGLPRRRLPGRSANLEDNSFVWAPFDMVGRFRVSGFRLRSTICFAWSAGGLLSSLAALASSTIDFSQCPTVLTPYEASYISSYNNLSLNGQRSLAPQESGGWLLSHTVEKLGSRISERSVFEAHNNQLRIRQYDMDQSIFKIRRKDRVHFDWENKVIRTSGRREGEIPLDGSYLDPLSHQLALRCDMARGAQQATYQVVKRGKVKPHRFRRVGTARLETALGPLDTVVVERVRDSDERSTRIWLAPVLNYLLVRLQQRDNEDDLEVTLQLHAVEFQ